jgi:two-component system nitrogen regulation response regulator NtrX
LRDRREDIPMLVREFSKEFTLEMNRKPIRFDDAAIKLLTSLPFSGNIRELRNVIERIVILVPREVVRVEDVEHLGLAFSTREQSANTASNGDSSPQPISDSAQDAPREEATDDLARSVILTDADLRRMEDVSPSYESESYFAWDKSNPLDEAMQAPTFQDFKDRAEKAFIEEKLREQNWNISRTAEALDIQRSHLYTKMRKFGLMKDGRAQEIPPNEQEPDAPETLEEEDDDVL